MATSVPANSDAPHKYVEELQLHAGRIGETLNWKNSQSGPPHNIVFTYCAKIGNELFPEAHGKTKKEAKYNAAKSAVETLKLQNAIHDMSLESTSRTPSPAGIANYISKLSEYGQKKNTRSEYKFDQMDTGIVHVQKFSCHVVIDNKEYPMGFGGSKQAAKHEAAKLAYEEIHKIQSPSENMAKPSPDLRDEEEPKSTAEDSPGQNLKRLTEDQSGENEKTNEECTATTSMDGSPPDSDSRMSNYGMKNAIGELNEYCQKRDLSCKIVDVDKRGPSHHPEFTLQFVISGKSFPSASGRSKQEAKQKAALLALKELQNQSGSISQDGNLSKENYPRKNFEPSDGSSFIVFEDNSAEPSTPKTGTTGGSRSKRRLAPTFNIPDTTSDSTSSQTDGNSEQDQSLEVNMNVPRIEGFSNIKEIGEGGFGCVYKAKKDFDKKYYAVKEVLMRNEKTKREVEHLAQMDHLNIVRYYNSWIGPRTRPNGLNKKSLFIQMALYEKDLTEWIEDPENNKPVQEAVALDIFRQLLDGVVYIHQNNRMHRDLKPDNIFLTEKTIVKIGDFGLVITVDDQKAPTRNVGTLLYMSPEQLRGDAYDHKVDIFALGLIFFQLLWIRHGTVAERREKWSDIRKSKFPSPFEERCLSQSLLIRKMLSEAASERPEAVEVQRRLESGCEQESKTI